MRRHLAALGGAVAVTALLACPQVASAGGSCPDADLLPTAANSARVETAVLCLVNRERQAAHRVALRRAPKLDLSARFHTASMVHRHFLAHEAPGQPSLLARVRGYGYFAGARDGIYGENVGVGPTTNGTARAMTASWMGSPEHRLNILYPAFRDVGIAAVPAGPDPAFYADFPSTVYTTDFGTRYTRPRCIRRPATGTSAPRRYCRAPARH